MRCLLLPFGLFKRDPEQLLTGVVDIEAVDFHILAAWLIPFRAVMVSSLRITMT